MEEEFKDFTVTPTLTFGETPDAQELPSTQSAAGDVMQTASQVTNDPAFSENQLTPEEKKMVDDFSKKIDLHNSQAILEYGVGTQKKMADFSGSCCNHPSVNPDQLLHHRVFIWRNHLFRFLHSCTASFQNTAWNGWKLFCGPVCHRLH